MRCLLLILFFAALTPVRAGLDARLIPVDARWLLYADLTTMRASPVGQELLNVLEPLFPDSETLHQPEAQRLRSLATTILIHGASFSPGGEPGDGVVLIEGMKFRSALKALVERSAAEAGSVFYKRTDLPFLAYGVRSTTNGGGSPRLAESAELVIAFPPGQLVLASKSCARLEQSVRLLDRRSPSLADAGKSPLSRFIPAARGTYFFGAVTITPALDSARGAGTAGNLLAFVGAGSLSFREAGSVTQARIDLLPAADHDPKKLLPTLQGLAALATNSSAIPPMARALILAADITQRDGLIIVRASCPTDTLVASPERAIGTNPVQSP